MGDARKEQALHSEKKLIRDAFVRMMTVNMLVMIASSICSFVDNLVIGNILDPEAMAAVGYFSPVATAVGLFGTVVLGTQILAGNFIGAGSRERISSLFFSSFTVLGVLSAVMAAGGILLRQNLAALLGVKESVRGMFCDYILGYMPGIPAQVLCSMLMGLVSYNNLMRRSCVSAVVMAAGNAAGDILLAGMGTLGIGLATTLSSVAALAVLLPGYTRKDKVLRFERTSLDLRLAGRAALRGFPSLMFTVGLIVKNTLFNRALSASADAAGVAVANVLSSFCSIIGIVTGGFGAAYVTLAGLYYGEEDRESLTGLLRLGIRIGEACMLTITAVCILGSSFLPGLFFSAGTKEWILGREMFRLAFLFFPVNIFNSCILNAYHAQGRTKLVSAMAAAETSLIGVTACLTVPLFGTRAAWLANTWVDLLCMAVLLCCGWYLKKKVSLRAEVLMALPDTFGASPDEYREYSIRNLQDVADASESVVAFCREKRMTDRDSFIAGLCVEEMARNIVQHGFRPQKNNAVAVRVVIQRELTIRIRDNCPEFDPRKRIELHDPAQGESNFGIRIASGMARRIDYYNNAGINNLILKI